MMTTFTWRSLVCFSASMAVLSFCGCGGDSGTAGPAGASGSGTTNSHAHPTEGPHHGSLIELGNEEYHAELLHDEATGSVTVYLLDASAQKAVPISATELLVNLSHDEDVEQFALAASPEGTDPPGKSSRFTSNDEELLEELDEEHSAAFLVVSIADKQYRGAIQHAHDHDEHDDH